MPFGVLQEMPGVSEAEYRQVETTPRPGPAAGPARPRRRPDRGRLADHQHLGGRGRVPPVPVGAAGPGRRPGGPGGRLRPGKAASVPLGDRRRRRDAVLMADAAALRARNAAFWDGRGTRLDPPRRPAGRARPAAGRGGDGLGCAARPGERILDVGCGCGGTTAELAGGGRAGPARRSASTWPRRWWPPPGSGSPRPAPRPAVRRGRHRDPRRRAGGAVRRGVLADGPDAAGRSGRRLRDDPAFAAPGRPARRDRLPRRQRQPVAVRGDARRAHRTSGRCRRCRSATSPARSPSPTRRGSPRVLTAAGFAAVAVTPYDVIMDAPDDADAVAEWLIEIGPAGAAYRAAPLGRAGRGPGGGRPAARPVPRARRRLPAPRRALARHRGDRAMIEHAAHPADPSGRAPAERRAEPGGDVGEDLHVVLVLEGERQRERDLVDLPERGVRVEPLGDLAPTCRRGRARTSAAPAPAASRSAACRLRGVLLVLRALLGRGACRWG